MISFPGSSQISIAASSQVSNIGIYKFSLRATDTYGQFGEHNFTITVANKDPVYDPAKTEFSYNFAEDISIDFS